jgi:hypothetical protein
MDRKMQVLFDDSAPGGLTSTQTMKIALFASWWCGILLAKRCADFAKPNTVRR